MPQTNGHGYVADQMGDVAAQAAYAAAPRDEAPDYTVERPIGEMFQELADDTRNLVNLELALAKAELSEKAAQTGRAAGFMAGGGFVIYAGFLAIMAAAILGLSYLLPPWLSALIVGAVVAVVGYVLLRKGMSDLKTSSMVPQRTIQTLRENKEWVQNQVH